MDAIVALVCLFACVVTLLGAALAMGGGRGSGGRLHRSTNPGSSVERRSRSRRDRLQVVANNLHRGRMARTGYHPGAVGVLGGRDVRVELRGEEGADDEVHAFSVESVEGFQGLTLEVRQETSDAGEAQGYAVDYASATPEQTARTAELLRDRRVKRALGQLFEDLGMDHVQIEGDMLTATRAGAGDLSSERVKRVLRALVLLSRSADDLAVRKPGLTVQAEASHVDWAKRNCPFCHDDLAEGERTSCEACHTVMHSECYEELGKCTTLGCEGRRAFPVLGDAGPARIVISGITCPDCGLRTAGCADGDCLSGRRERNLHRVRVRGDRRRARSRSRSRWE